DQSADCRCKVASAARLLQVETSDRIIPTRRCHFCDSKRLRGTAIMASRALKIDPTKSEQNNVTSKPLNESVQPAVSDNVWEVEIAALAYQYWQGRGCPIGSEIRSD